MYINKKMIEFVLENECSYKEAGIMFNMSESSARKMGEAMKRVDAEKYAMLKSIMAHRKKNGVKLGEELKSGVRKAEYMMGGTKKDLYTAMGHSHKTKVDENTECSSRFSSKMKKIKTYVKPGAKVGPYTVVGVYPHHCTVIDKKGVKESFTYQELAKYLK